MFPFSGVSRYASYSHINYKAYVVLICCYSAKYTSPQDFTFDMDSYILLPVSNQPSLINLITDDTHPRYIVNTDC